MESINPGKFAEECENRPPVTTKQEQAAMGVLTKYFLVQYDQKSKSERIQDRAAISEVMDVFKEFLRPNQLTLQLALGVIAHLQAIDGMSRETVKLKTLGSVVRELSGAERRVEKATNKLILDLERFYSRKTIEHHLFITALKGALNSIVWARTVLDASKSNGKTVKRSTKAKNLGRTLAEFEQFLSKKKSNKTLRYGGRFLNRFRGMADPDGRPEHVTLVPVRMLVLLSSAAGIFLTEDGIISSSHRVKSRARHQDKLKNS